MGFPNNAATIPRMPYPMLTVIAAVARNGAIGKDNALLRFSLGLHYLNAADPARAAPHLRAAVAHDPGYSAAWKLLGRALGETGARDEAREAYRRGIEAADRKGDIGNAGDNSAGDTREAQALGDFTRDGFELGP